MISAQFQVGDVVKHSYSKAFTYKVVMISPNGTLYCQTRLDNVPAYFPPSQQATLIKVEEDDDEHPNL